MAGSSKKAAEEKRKGRGRPFRKGQSGNPTGLPKHVRERRQHVREALEAAFTQGGTDELVEALVDGVRARDSTCLKLACEYRWGRPTQQVDLNAPDGDMSLEVRFVKPLDAG